MSTNIKVCVRVRPENEKERALAQPPVVHVVDEVMLVFDPVINHSVRYFHGKVLKDPTSRKPRDAKFAFDRVFGPSVTNIEVYEQTTKSVLRSLVEGYNCSVFAYGATGAGKTFSMLGSPQTPGVIFLSMMDLYNIKESMKEERLIEVSVSYLEVYNENIKDLLSPGNGNLPIRENGAQGIVITGLTVRRPNSAEELLQMLEKGNKNRTQHPTDANAESSRSHAVFQVFVRVTNCSSGLSKDVKVCKLSLIDLAGSERATVNTNRGARFREGANINKSLLALGNCINALADTKRKGNKHVPYRNSKLTRILKDSLGENCKTVMLAAISPSRHSYEDTYNTLSYADRAKKIKAVLKKNVFSVQTRIQNYGKVVDDLHTEIAKLKEKLQTQTVHLAEFSARDVLTASSAAKSAATSACSFDIDQLQTEISVSYGERRQIRADILHAEAMQRQTRFNANKKQTILDRLALVSSISQGQSAAGDKTVNKVARAIDSANRKQKSLEATKELELRLLEENTARLKELVAASNCVDNSHAQTILELQMKVYHYEQESLEHQRNNEHLVKLVNSMREDRGNTERLVETFVRFLGTSEQLLNKYGLQSQDLSQMYQNIKDFIVNEHHVQFDADNPGQVADDSNEFKTLTKLSIISANENSLALTGKPILLGAAAADETVVLGDANCTFTLTDDRSASPVTTNSPVLHFSPDTQPTVDAVQPVHSPLTDTVTACNGLSPSSNAASTGSPTDDSGPQQVAGSREVMESPKTHSTPQSAQTQSCTPPSVTPVTSPPHMHNLRQGGSDGIHQTESSRTSPPSFSFTKLRRSPRISSHSRTIFRPVDEVLSLIKGTGCSEQEDPELSPDCPPAKLRVVSRPLSSPDQSSHPAQLDTTPVALPVEEPRRRVVYDDCVTDSSSQAATDGEEPVNDRLLRMDTTETFASPCQLSNMTVTLATHSSAWADSPTSSFPYSDSSGSRTFADVLKSPAVHTGGSTSRRLAASSVQASPGLVVAGAPSSLVPPAGDVLTSTAPLSRVDNTPHKHTASVPGYIKMTKASSAKRSDCHRQAQPENSIS